MKTVTLLIALLLFPMVPLHAQSSQTDADGGGWGGVLTAKDGTVVAFQSPGGGNCRRSLDGGKTWDADILIAPDAINGRALVDETKGDILYVNPRAGWLFRSRDSGATWTRESLQVRPDGFGNIPDPALGVLAMQCGITLAFGERKGRLIIPARVAGPKHSNVVEWRPYHYSTALYSDDGGFVSVPSASTLQFTDARFSIAAWVNPYELDAGQQMIVAKNVYSADQREWGLMLDNDNRFRFYL